MKSDNPTHPDYDLDLALTQLLRRQNPRLYGVIQALLELGQTPNQIGRRVERQTGPDSVLPGLCEASARTLRRNTPGKDL